MRIGIEQTELPPDLVESLAAGVDAVVLRGGA
jgi:hypothetical protein